MSGLPALIVDGYNVLRASEGSYSGLAERDLDAARTRLVADVAAYAHGQFDAVVVFDGGANPLSDGRPHEIAGVTVIFSPSGIDADTVIEHQVAVLKSTGRVITVVTSDAATQWAVMGSGVIRQSAAGLIDELAAADAEYRASNPSGTKRSTLDERVDPAVTERLSRWARGES